MAIRVLHIVFSLDRGGMENGLVNVANRLDPEDFEVRVLCLERRGVFADRLRSGIPVDVIGRWRRGVCPKLLFGVAHHLRQTKPDLIHTHNMGTLVYAAMAGFSRNTSILHGEHAQLEPSETTSRKNLQRKILYRRCCEIHTVSDELRSQLVRFVTGHPPLYAIPNGVDTLRFAPSLEENWTARSAINLPDTGVVIGLLGRMIPAKRHFDMLIAFERVLENFPDTHLLLVGDDGPECDRVLERIATSPASSHIHFRKFRPDPEVYYRAIDLLVAPSRVEGMSNVIIEAMACGVPSLVHSACGNAEVVENNIQGVVAPLDTPDQIAGHVCSLLGDARLLRAMRIAARERVEDAFSIDGMVRSYAETYERVAFRSGKMS